MSATGSDAADAPENGDDTPLRRAIGPKLLIFFVIGDILGTGIYATTGQVAGKVGGALWLPFVIGFVVAILTAASYVELVGKYPQAAGAALSTQKAFQVPFLTFIVAFTVMCSGLCNVWRWRYDQFGWTSRSTQLQERRLLKWGGPLFHYGTFAAIAGHLMGILIPESFTRWLGIPEDTYRWFSSIGGTVAALAVIFGVVILAFRRTTVPKVRATPAPSTGWPSSCSPSSSCSASSPPWA